LVRGLPFFLRCSLAVCLAAQFLRGAAAAQTFAVAPAASRAEFSVRHLFLSRASGAVPIVAASIVLDDATGLPRSVEATLDPRRIDTHNAARDRDLQRASWFDTERFPAIRFTGGPASGSAEAFDVPGRLTIKDVTLGVTLHVTQSVVDATHRRYHATAGVSRHAFGLYASNADGLVGDDVSIDLTLEAASE
jgi:polyisoprenoid-binding protein YceI